MPTPRKYQTEEERLAAKREASRRSYHAAIAAGKPRRVKTEEQKAAERARYHADPERFRAASRAWRARPGSRERERESKRALYAKRKEEQCAFYCERNRINNDASKEAAKLHYRAWDPADELWLVENYRKLTSRKCAEHLGRSMFAVRSRFKQLTSTETQNG